MNYLQDAYDTIAEITPTDDLILIKGQYSALLQVRGLVVKELIQAGHAYKKSFLQTYKAKNVPDEKGKMPSDASLCKIVDEIHIDAKLFYKENKLVLEAIDVKIDALGRFMSVYQSELKLNPRQEGQV